MNDMLVFENTGDTNKLCCCMVCFVFIFIILIMAICWTNYECFENFGNIIKHNHETFTNILAGGMHYLSLSPSDDILKKFDQLKKNHKIALVAILAPWCGHCKRLKESGILTKIAKKYTVLIVDDKHPQTQNLMEILQAEGFPSLGIFTGENLIPYNGPRDVASLEPIMKKIQFMESKRNTHTLHSEKFTNQNKKNGKIIKATNNISPKSIKNQILQYQKKGYKVCTIFMADWCGHCKNLKKEKIMEKLADNGVIIFAIDDSHPLTKEMDIKGFPSIICWKGMTPTKYEGPREPGYIFAALKN
jgi:thiol-disulfide isomerase/thioredoxin